MRKIALVSYHRNILNLYPAKWVNEYRHSILSQTHKDFQIYELNYGGDQYRIFDNSIFHSKEFPSFVYALNYLLDCLFFMGYDCVFNSNADDHYDLSWIEKQLSYVENGFDLVASNFALVKDDSIIKKHSFDKLDIAFELAHNHNVISHPSVCYSAKFWQKNRYIPEQQPMEDLMLWQRAIKDSRFIILPDVLLYHRLHSNSVCENPLNK